MEITKNTKVRRSKNQEHNYLDDEVVMLNVEDCNMYNFNEVGTRIWELLEDKVFSVEELALKLIKEFDVFKEDCINDIILFVKDISKKGLLEIA
ncbi:MAG: PqqD family protein [Pseudomonadota bacterium]